MSESKPLTIVELTASNVKRLRAVHIKPDGAAVVLGGKNGQGKSSVLDAITMALGGKDLMPRVPVRKGEERGEIVVDLGEIVVRRVITPEGGGTLTVSSREGARFPSPQAMLDKLTGQLTFDPLAFSRMAPAEQSETLRRMVGLDFTALDQERGNLYVTRADVNRDGKAMAARFATMPVHADAPASEVSSAAILAEQEKATKEHEARLAKARATNEAIDAKKRASGDAEAQAQRAEAEAHHAEAFRDQTIEEINRLRALLVKQEDEANSKRAAAGVARAKAAKALSEAAGLTYDSPAPIDLAPFRARLATVEATNAKVRANAARAAAEKALNEKRAESARLTARIDAIDREKAAAIAAAAMPVEGLGFDADGVTLDGLPFEQASQAQQLRVSVAMGFAMNPRLRVLLIRDASLLDAESLAMVAKMAEDVGGQCWMERVEQDGATTVLIEDGNATAVEKVSAEA